MAYDLAENIATGDLLLNNNDLMVIDNAERVAQQILITLRFWLGEWFLDTTQGVPYLEYILIKNPNENHIRQILTDAILSVEGVETVDNMELDFDTRNRKMAVTYTVTTDYGLVTRREVLGYANN